MSRLALSDTLRIAAERIGARLKTGSLAGPVETQIRGRSGSLDGLAVAGRTSHDGSTHASRRRGVTGRAPYCSSGGGERSSTSPFGAFQQIQRIGLDQQRAALALDLPDLLDAGKHVLQMGASPSHASWT